MVESTPSLRVHARPATIRVEMAANPLRVGRQKSAATAKTLSGWDVAAFQKKLEEENFYEAHQIVKAAAQRHLQSNDVVTACGLINTAVRALLSSSDSQAEAADLVETAIEYLSETQNKDAANQLSQAVLNAEVAKLCGLYAAWIPGTPDLVKRKLESLRKLMTLSAKANNGLVQSSVHTEVAHACVAIREFKGAVDNFAAAGDAVGAALALEAWVETMRIPSTEIDLLVTRTVLQFLLFQDTSGADQLRTRCEKSAALGVAFSGSPLRNFTKFLVATFAAKLGKPIGPGSASDENTTSAAVAVPKPDKTSLLGFVQVLFDQYSPALRRDPEFTSYYFPHLKRIHFGVDLPAHLKQSSRQQGGG